MNLVQLVKPDNILCNVLARSKTHYLEILSELLTRTNLGITSDEIFARLIDRERLGSTCHDEGVAFPHCRISGLKRSYGVLIKLNKSVDFDLPDGQLIDLVFGFMAPEHLATENLAYIGLYTEILMDSTFCATLRVQKSSKDLYSALLAEQNSQMPKLETA